MAKPIPMIPEPQVVPSTVCFQCDVCCRFPEHQSLLRPYFTADEIRQAVARGINPYSFPDHRGSQVKVIAHPSGEGFICPAFDPATHHCRIYDVRPLDCQLYPFVLMWNEQHNTVLLGWDTLCPFLSAPALKDTPQEKKSLSSTVELPKPLMEQSRTIASYLESEDVLRTLAFHPRLVTPFQPGVVVLHRLKRLTALLRASSTPVRG